MALVGPHSGGQSLCPSFLSRNKSNHVFFPNAILSISKNTKKTPQRFVSASATSSGSALVVGSPPLVKTADSQGEDAIFSGNIDSWMQESVADIVRNLKQAPLLVKIHSENDGRVKIQTEKAIAKDWPVLKSEWRRGESRSPDGLIFVEELEKNPDQDQDFGEGVTRAWGIVVQEKGEECAPTCYLLKTNRVCGGDGFGVLHTFLSDEGE
ncbi:UNVERIFIED_CONTAM: hypothetical protein Sradi_6265000 [Sesamum radiatum]|uniref:DUF7804 domain-containing protein n=1 Tax=Sesamum radiatum TaxID=300843 RepID=A0AAW2KC31_SESRA